MHYHIDMITHGRPLLNQSSALVREMVKIVKGFQMLRFSNFNDEETQRRWIHVNPWFTKQDLFITQEVFVVTDCN